MADLLIFFMFRAGRFSKLKNWRGPLLFCLLNT